LNGDFHGFSADLCKTWVRVPSTAPLAPGAVPGYRNFYRRENCASPATYEALTTVKPPNRPPTRYFEQAIQGFSADASHTIYTVNGALHEDAPTVGEFEVLLYEHTPAGLRFVCYLPGGGTKSAPCAAGTLGAQRRRLPVEQPQRDLGRAGSGSSGPTPPAAGAAGDPTSAGPIYVRDRRPARRSRSRPTSLLPRPTTGSAAADGSKAIFEFDSGALQDELYEFDVDAALAGDPSPERRIAGDVLGPMGASEDASRIYFASREDLDESGPAADGARKPLPL
jgi:hypothetical protein